MTSLNPKHISICVCVLLALGATTSPALAQEDGLNGGKIILIENQGKKKGKKKDTTSTTGTSTSGTSTTASKCGNGVIDAGEQCDGAAVPAARSCPSGFIRVHHCMPNCTLYSGCEGNL